MIFGWDRVSCNDFGDCHEETIVACNDFISRQLICGLYPQGGVLLGALYEDSDSWSSMRSLMVTERIPRSPDNDFADYVVTDDVLSTI
jgi:hypothetical protein